MILFAGFQAGGTRGASMVRGAAEVKIHGAFVPIEAEVRQISNLSAHADADELIAWMRGLGRGPRRTFVNHGEPDAADTLRRRIGDELGWAAEVPDYRDHATLD
jgi:metallo-beta-lactamase family protein